MPRDRRPRVSLQEVTDVAELGEFGRFVTRGGDAARPRGWRIVADGASAGAVTAAPAGDRVEVCVFVDPAVRRRGIGRQALGRVIGARPFGAEVLSVSTDARDDAMHGLLRATGFTIVDDRGGVRWERATGSRAQHGPQRFLTPDGRIERYPVRADDLQALLELVLPRVLSPGEVLTERELNARLAHLTDDTALLRRNLVDHELVERTPSGTEYALAEPVDNS